MVICLIFHSEIPKFDTIQQFVYSFTSKIRYMAFCFWIMANLSPLQFKPEVSIRKFYNWPFLGIEPDTYGMEVSQAFHSSMLLFYKRWINSTTRYIQYYFTITWSINICTNILFHMYNQIKYYDNLCLNSKFMESQCQHSIIKLMKNLLETHWYCFIEVVGKMRRLDVNLSAMY